MTRYAGGPFGHALAAYQRGGPVARAREVLEMRSDLGEREAIPVSIFFRETADFFSFEREALARCVGRVLDLGAGAGVHGLPLQERGLEVVAVEVDASACRVARARGVRRVVRADGFALPFGQGAFDSVIMLMNGAGLAGTLEGLRVLLDRLALVVAPGGQLLVDSADLRSDEERDGPFARREDGRYVGEVQIQLGFRGEWGDPFPELYVDPDTLTAVAGETGWKSRIVLREEDGSFLARLSRP